MEQSEVGNFDFMICQRKEANVETGGGQVVIYSQAI
jgi:hypothetical protein